MKVHSAHRSFYFLLGTLFFLLSSLAFTLEGTNGGGDTILHYLMSHFAWKHPYLFFDHWGKPIFTILSSPFAYFGMPFLKWFNVMVTCGACWFTYHIAAKMKLVNPLWVLPLYFCAPESFHVTLSGLTEPLFACLFAMSMFLYLKKKDIAATIIISFLPLSRSEGLFIVILAIVYLLAMRKYRFIPLLLCGQFIITLAGAFHYKDIFWVFTKIPYATVSTNYETGSIFHFANHLPYVFGLPSVILLTTGSLYYLFRLINKTAQPSTDSKFYFKLFFVYGGFFSFFICHSVFHYFGIFNEMGLTRVLVAVMPSMVLIALDGIAYLQQALEKIKPKYPRMFVGVLLVMTMAFYGFGFTHFSVDYDKNLVLNADQKLISKSMIPYLNSHYPGATVYTSNAMIPFYLGNDLFAEGTYSRTLAPLKPDMKLESNQVLIWDSWYSVVEEKVTKEQLLQLPWLKSDTSFFYYNRWNEPLEFMIFKPVESYHVIQVK